MNFWNNLYKFFFFDMQHMKIYISPLMWIFCKTLKENQQEIKVILPEAEDYKIWRKFLGGNL